MPRPPAESNVILCCDCEGTGRQLARLYNVIRAAGLPANFFFVGETARAYPKLVQEISLHHQTESHTLTHRNLRQLSHARQRSEILGGKHAVEDVIQRPTHGFRAPMHHLNRDTVRILNEERFLFDASRLYFRYDMGSVIEIDPTWFREWMPLYEAMGLRPRTAFHWFRFLTRMRRLSVLPLHPHYAGKSPELARALAWFLDDAKQRGVRFWFINDWLREMHGVEMGPDHDPPSARR